MRVMFAVSDWPSHYFPMVPLGWALQSAGHEVRVVCPPRQAGPVGQAGLTPVPILGDLDMSFLARFVNLRAARSGDRLYEGIPLLHPRTTEPLTDPLSLDEQAFAELTQEIGAETAGETERGAAAAVDFARRWRPDLVVHDRLSMDGPLAARAIGVPHVAHLWGSVGTNEENPALHPVPVDRTGIFARHGLPPMGPELMEYVIDPCPEALRPPTDADRLPVRYVPYNGPGTLRPWVLGKPSRPRVCIMWSNSVTQIYGRASYLVPDIIKGLAGFDAEIVLLAHPDDREHLGSLPDSVRVLEQFPLHLLLPTCAAIVHHGGGGSMMTAMAAGVPQLALAFGAETTTDGERMAATGAGLFIRGDAARAETIGAAVAELHRQPSYRANAVSLAQESALRPVPTALVPRLVQIAAGGRRG